MARLRVLRLVTTLLQRPDFRRNPAKALWRRTVWKARWLVSRGPWHLTWRGHFRIAVLHDGLGARLFSTGACEPEVEEFCLRFLRPGMVFFDVGAHVGAYTLLCADAVGPRGRVCAFEPDPRTSRLLELNIERNGLANARAERCAVSDEDGESRFELCAESSVSSLLGAGGRAARGRSSRIITVPTVRLDTWCARSGVRPALVKVDAEGAELPIFRGAAGLLRLPSAEAPVWIFEREPSNYARFGYDTQSMLAFLRGTGCRLWSFRGGGRLKPLDGAAWPDTPVSLVAAQEGIWLPSLL